MEEISGGEKHIYLLFLWQLSSLKYHAKSDKRLGSTGPAARLGVVDTTAQ